MELAGKGNPKIPRPKVHLPMEESMGRELKKEIPVKTKAYLLDPVHMKVLWMNESAAKDIKGSEGTQREDISIEDAVPMARIIGLPEAIAEVHGSGAPKHLRSSLISSKRGGLSTVASIYPLPDGKILLLIELGLDWKRDRGRDAERQRYLR